MKTYKDVCILEGNLASFINTYILPLREGIGFEIFSDECILYSLLEYSKFIRPYSEEQRILYLYEKCSEYSGHRADVKVDFDHYGKFIITTLNDLPF